jgi:hypothetical protein
MAARAPVGQDERVVDEEQRQVRRERREDRRGELDRVHADQLDDVVDVLVLLVADVDVPVVERLVDELHWPAVGRLGCFVPGYAHVLVRRLFVSSLLPTNRE